jgi:hypothetical protein
MTLYGQPNPPLHPTLHCACPLVLGPTMCNPPSPPDLGCIAAFIAMVSTGQRTSLFVTFFNLFILARSVFIVSGVRPWILGL